MDDSVGSRQGADGAAGDAVASARVHASVFAPALAVGAIYGGAWLALAAYGRGEEDFARLLLLIFAVGTPLLLAHAWLRYRAAGITVAGDAVVVARGWPYGTARSLPFADVAGVDVRRSPLGRLLGTGTLVVRLRDGEHLSVGDIGQPERIAEALRGRLR